MMETLLKSRLAPLARMIRKERLFRMLAMCWTLAAAAGLALFLAEIIIGQAFYQQIWIVPLAAGLIMAAAVLIRQKRRADELQDVIRNIEPQQPEVQHLLVTAAEQRPAESSGSFSFLQLRVIEEALAYPKQASWRQQLKNRLTLAQAFNAGALLMLAAVVLLLHQGARKGTSIFAALTGQEITVTPGDAQVERGTGLVVAARFGGTPPAEATLVLNYASGKESRIPMARRLADPVFGASVPEISEAGVYHIDYPGKKTRDYKISVFEYPALLRADAALSYPSYTGMTNRTILDTLRVSAVEGSRLNYTLQLNKPVALARLDGTNQSLTLMAQSNATALLPDFLLTNSAHYSLELVDADGRSNKFPTEIVFQALANERPNVKLVFPRGDPRVSRLEELQLQAEASDDFGVIKYGIGFGVAGNEPKLIELGKSVPGNTKRQFGYLIALEKLNVDVDQAVAYFAWADDYGPDGKERRTYSDMFFAEVRPFEEIFRQEQGGGSGNPPARLADLQKQIVVATWDLQREKAGAGGAQHP